MRFAANIKAPPPWVVQTLAQRAGPTFWNEFTEAAERAVAGLEVTMNSWWRSAERQAELRAAGAPAATYSQHLLGTAFDLVGPDAWPSTRAADALRAEGFFVVHHAGHTHAQAFSADQLSALSDLMVRVGAGA